MQERVIYIELLTPKEMAISFSGLFDVDIKDSIKAMEGAHYDSNSKLWIMSIELKERLINTIGEKCLENGVKISDIPQFAFDMLRIKIPFESCKGKYKKIGDSFEYHKDLAKKKSVDDLPEVIKRSLYDF